MTPQDVFDTVSYRHLNTRFVDFVEKKNRGENDTLGEKLFD